MGFDLGPDDRVYIEENMSVTRVENAPFHGMRPISRFTQGPDVWIVVLV